MVATLCLGVPLVVSLFSLAAPGDSPYMDGRTLALAGLGVGIGMACFLVAVSHFGLLDETDASTSVATWFRPPGLFAGAATASVGALGLWAFGLEPLTYWGSVTSEGPPMLLGLSGLGLVVSVEVNARHRPEEVADRS